MASSHPQLDGKHPLYAEYPLRAHGSRMVGRIQSWPQAQKDKAAALTLQATSSGGSKEGCCVQVGITRHLEG